MHSKAHKGLAVAVVVLTAAALLFLAFSLNPRKARAGESFTARGNLSFYLRGPRGPVILPATQITNLLVGSTALVPAGATVTYERKKVFVTYEGLATLTVEVTVRLSQSFPPGRNAVNMYLPGLNRVAVSLGALPDFPRTNQTQVNADTWTLAEFEVCR